jgi:hypothetical protein
MTGRTADLTKELAQVIRLAPTRPEELAGRLPVLAGFHRVQTAGELTEEARLHVVLHELIPAYVNRIPPSRIGLAIRELFAWKDEQGYAQTLDSRYRKAAKHILCSTTDFGRRREEPLRKECAGYFIQFDHEDRRAAPAPDAAEGAAHHANPTMVPADDPLAGIVGVYRQLDHHRLADEIREGTDIAILNTWIPELNFLEFPLLEALAMGASVRILMLQPDSRASSMRSAGLRATTVAHGDRVRLGVRQCLDVLGSIASSLDDESRPRLRVRLYDSLPSIAVYSIDGRALVSVFLHGTLAVRAPQIDVRGNDSLLGAAVFGEFETLWNMAVEEEL